VINNVSVATTAHVGHCKKQSISSLCFFLPVIPYKTDYLMYCPICGNTELLTADGYDKKIRYEAEPFKE